METGFSEGSRVPASAADATRQQQLMESFCGITSASPDEALFFLESHNWQLDAAIHSFYDASSDHDDPAAASIAPPQPRRREAPDDDDEVGIDDDDDEDYVPPALVRREASPPVVRGRDAKKKKRSGEGSGTTRGRGIRTLADLNKEADGSGSDEDEDDEGMEYYTGGEKSGMLVRDPSKRKNDVDAIFEQARQMGVQQGPLETAHSSGSRSFTGTGRLLSGETVPVAPRPQQPENITHDITFWTNGFSVDDGPLRQFDDPANESFLESIRRSECPKELEPADRRSSVHVNLMRKEEKYPEPVQRQTPFQGIARTLGTGAAADLESHPPVSSPITSSSSPLSAGFSVDDTVPSTSIQLRLAGGSRIVGRFNMHHTVGNIRSFIDSSHPGGTRNYILQTVGFPPKQLTDLSQTIEQAGLANSVVIQRLQ